MLRGIVKFRARVVDQERGVTFPLFEFNPNTMGVDKVEIEAPNDREIRITVHLSAVADRDAGIEIAETVHKAALNRISFCHNLAIENGWVSEDEFFSIDPEAEDALNAQIGQNIRVVDGHRISLSIPIADLKPELEQAQLPGEGNFDLFRSARQSRSAVEEFMHLYNILLMLFDDEQAGVDDFIIKQNPDVTKKQRPKFKPPRRRSLKVETVYTRLRNELGHKREGVNVDDTKAEMTKRLHELRELTKRAIERS
jgi:hypothetical protein